MLNNFTMFVFWIDKNKFITGMLEEFAKKFDVKLYTLNSLEGCSYLLDDLNPDVVVLDGETFQISSDELKAVAMQKLAGRKLISTGKATLPTELNIIGNIMKPLDVAVVFDTISRLVIQKH
jgi:hypothetical protein